jgi:hypothetical protein
VIGVLARKGVTPIGLDQDDQIFLPLEALPGGSSGRFAPIGAPPWGW